MRAKTEFDNSKAAKDNRKRREGLILVQILKIYSSPLLAPVIFRVTLFSAFAGTACFRRFSRFLLPVLRMQKFSKNLLH